MSMASPAKKTVHGHHHKGKHNKLTHFLCFPINTTQVIYKKELQVTFNKIQNSNENIFKINVN